MKACGVSQITWHLHLCRNAAYWRGGQFARAHAEFLRLLAQAGRTPQPVFVTIWTDEVSCQRSYARWLAALGLAALPQGIDIRCVALGREWAWFGDAADPAGQTAAGIAHWLTQWEEAVARRMDAASLELGEVFPDAPPAWLADYLQTPLCSLLAAYPASGALACTKPVPPHG